MRAEPAGLVTDDSVEAYRLGRDLAALTHGHPSGWIAAGGFAAIICELVNGTEPKQPVPRGLLMVESEEAGSEVAEALRHAVAISELSEMTVLDVEELGQGWTAEEALAISVACILTDLEPQEQFLLAVNHSGDSDSTGSILGNLIGANKGIQAIPLQWCEDLELVSVIESVAGALCPN